MYRDQPGRTGLYPVLPGLRRLVVYNAGMFLRTLFSGIVLIAASIAAPRAHAQNALTAAVTAPSIWVRTAPSFDATPIGPVFTGDALTVQSQSPDGRWLRVSNTVRNRAGWMPADFAKLNGKLEAVPVVSTTLPAVKNKLQPLPTWISVPAAAKKQYAALLKKGRPGNIFTVAGDCNSEPDAYIRRLANGAFDASKYPQFAGVLRRFERSFMRRSYAASGSFSAQAMFDPNWVDPAICHAEGPLVCEVWRSSASIVFVSLGTGDQFDWKDFEPHYTKVISTALERGALPVLFTKSDVLETQQHGAPPEAINGIIRRVAAERGLPLIDFAVIAKTLPNQGLKDEGNIDFHLNEAGSDMRIVGTLYVLQHLAGP
jgi:hypothetical protein